MDEMNPRDRIDAAIALQPVDRAPLVPMMDIFSPRFEGVKMADMIRDLDLARETLIKGFDDLGGWDATFLAGGMVSDIGWGNFGMASKLPGYELGDDDLWQLDEKEILKIEDYDFIIKNGWNAYLGLAYPRLGAPCDPALFFPHLGALAAQGVKDTLIWEAKGVQAFAGFGPPPPFEAVTFSRSLKETVADIFRRPALLEAALDAIQAEQVPFMIGGLLAVKQATKWGNKVAFIGATRAPFLSPPNFERFFWKYLKDMVNQMVAAGITPMLHFDSNWDKYLEKFLELPKGKVVLELDSTTNIFKAKEILKGHMCIMGDVPASLLKLGTPEQVCDYCKKLIDVVGEGSGFILSTGCDCPMDAKPENVKAMLETGRTYNPNHKVF